MLASPPPIACKHLVSRARLPPDRSASQVDDIGLAGQPSGASGQHILTTNLALTAVRTAFLQVARDRGASSNVLLAATTRRQHRPPASAASAA
jgi:hypothetical protein